MFAHARGVSLRTKGLRRILSPARLPFRHAGLLEGAKEYEFRGEPQTAPTKSSGCRLRGGPKISRKMIASCRLNVDLNIAAMCKRFVLGCAPAG